MFLKELLKQENEELEERIEKLEREREDVIRDMKVVKFIGELQCLKDYQCYKRNYVALCETESFGETKIYVVWKKNLRHSYLRHCRMIHIIVNVRFAGIFLSKLRNEQV